MRAFSFPVFVFLCMLCSESSDIAKVFVTDGKRIMLCISANFLRCYFDVEFSTQRRQYKALGAVSQPVRCSSTFFSKWHYRQAKLCWTDHGWKASRASKPIVFFSVGHVTTLGPMRMKLRPTHTYNHRQPSEFFLCCIATNQIHRTHHPLHSTLFFLSPLFLWSSIKQDPK